MQFITVVETEKYQRTTEGAKIRLPNGQLAKQKIPAGTVFEGKEHLELVVYGYAVPHDNEAKDLVKAKGINISKQIRGRQVVESINIVTELATPPT